MAESAPKRRRFEPTPEPPAFLTAMIVDFQMPVHPRSPKNPGKPRSSGLPKLPFVPLPPIPEAHYHIE